MMNKGPQQYLYTVWFEWKFRPPYDSLPTWRGVLTKPTGTRFIGTYQQCLDKVRTQFNFDFQVDDLSPCSDYGDYYPVVLMPKDMRGEVEIRLCKYCSLTEAEIQAYAQMEETL